MPKKQDEIGSANGRMKERRSRVERRRMATRPRGTPGDGLEYCYAPSDGYCGSTVGNLSRSGEKERYTIVV